MDHKQSRKEGIIKFVILTLLALALILLAFDPDAEQNTSEQNRNVKYRFDKFNLPNGKICYAVYNDFHGGAMGVTCDIYNSKMTNSEDN